MNTKSPAPHRNHGRNTRILASVTALFAATMVSCTPQTPDGRDTTVTSAKPPNILFVFTDDHASHAISAYGSVINTTPNLDRLANEGMLFRNAFVTNSICAPSRAVILTGILVPIVGRFVCAPEPLREPPFRHRAPREEG